MCIYVGVFVPVCEGAHAHCEHISVCLLVCVFVCVWLDIDNAHACLFIQSIAVLFLEPAARTLFLEMHNGPCDIAMVLLPACLLDGK